MVTIEKLNAFGADTKDGLARCYGSEDLYLKLVCMIPGDKNFETLQQSVAAGDYRQGFEAAHALKGVLGNLSLTPLYERISALTELLRIQQAADYAPMLAEIAALRDELAAMCG